MKKIFGGVLAAAMLLSAAGCGSGGAVEDLFQGAASETEAGTSAPANPAETPAQEAEPSAPADAQASEAVKVEAETVYQLSYFGVSVLVPQGYYIQDQSAFNFSADPADTDDLSKLDYSSYEGWAYFYMGSLSSGFDINDRDTAELALWVERDEVLDYGEFVDDCQDYYLKDNSYAENNWNITYEGESVEVMNGVEYVVLSYLVSAQSSSQTAFYETYYIAEIGSHTYLTVYTSYWKNNLVGQMEAGQSVAKLVTVDTGAPGLQEGQFPGGSLA